MSFTFVTTSMEANLADQIVNPIEDTASPFYLQLSENHSSVIIMPKLTFSNYPCWRRSFQLVVSIRNKQGFLDGSVLKCTPKDSLYLSLIRCNNLIIAWLLRLISSSIASTVFYLEDAKQIWDKLLQRFSQPNESRIYHLQNLLYIVIQGTKSVDAYFTELNRIWDELRIYKHFLSYS